MFPVLLDLKVIKIYTLGVFLVLAFFWGMFMLWRNIKLTAYKEEEIFDGLFLSLFGGLVVSRFLYVSLNFADFGLSPFKFLLINGYPGLSLLGFILGACAVLAVYFQRAKIPLLKIFDYFVPATFLALAIGKIGSFFAGLDVGGKTSFFLAVKYFGYDGHRHVVALYEALILALAVYFAYRLLLAVRRGTLPHGFVFYFFLWYFAESNLLLDNLKVNHLYFLGRSVNLIVSVAFVIFFTGYFLYFFRARLAAKLNTVTGPLLHYVSKTRRHIKGKTQKGAV